MIDLFAGCGGLSLGFEDAGFTPVFVNELNKDAMATYLQNRHHELGGLLFRENVDLRCNDAHELKGKRLEQLKHDLAGIEGVRLSFEKGRRENGAGSNLDVLAGGPPCQGYSGIGIRRSYSVDRQDIPSNQLYQRMAAVIRELRPRIFLFENVRGLLNARWTKDGEKGQIFEDVKQEFRDITGYEVRHKLVYAKDYGVPQNRPRVLLVGIRKDIVDACDFIDPTADPEDAVMCGFLPPKAENEYPHLIDLLGDLVDAEIGEILHSGKFPKGPFRSSNYPGPPRTGIQKQLRQPPPWHKGKINLTEQEYSKHGKQIVKKFTHMQENNGEIPSDLKTKKFSQRVLPSTWGNKEPNFTVTSLPDDVVHFSQPRSLTVREWARIQLFPDWYQFSGIRTTGGLRRAGNPRAGLFDREVPKYTQIGNAVPVELAKRVAHHFKMIIDEVFK